MDKIKIGIIGVGNCASSLLQGIEYYKNKTPKNAIGLMRWKIGGYQPSDIEVGLAFDIDKRKVGIDVNLAIFKKPNCTKIFHSDMPMSGVKVKMGKIADGLAEHMDIYEEEISFRVSSEREPTKEEVVGMIRESGIDMLVNYLPVGSEKATEFYVECALEARVGFVNNIPVFIASDPIWTKKFEDRGLPIIGDDIKAQLGATIVHRTLVDLFKKRGVKIDRSYQLNVGGNTDFLNMLDKKRLYSKKISKTEAVQSVGNFEDPQNNLHVGPSDFVPWQKDNKVCFTRIEGRLFGDVPMELELRLSVEDSPNSAGVAIDAIRCCKLAIDNKVCGNLVEPSAYFCKHPMYQYVDSQAHSMLNDFIDKYSQVATVAFA